MELKSIIDIVNPSMAIDIPVELVEMILLNLPVKSLLRFSAVSKSWNRMIKSPEFRKRYRGRQMMVLRVNSDSEQPKALAFPHSLSLLSLSIANATPFVLPFTAEPFSDVSCGELRCVEFENSLCLYNPSTRACRKLPTPLCAPPIGSTLTEMPLSLYAYGLGYDVASDDYKVVKFRRDSIKKFEVYSLRSDCWRELSDCQSEIQSCIPGGGRRTALPSRGVFVDGSLHWLVHNRRLESEDGSRIAILSFHVSTEKFGRIATPAAASESLRCSGHMDLYVLRGRLCLCLTDKWLRFFVWEYNNNDNDNGTWSKDLEIDYSNMHPLRYAPRLQPLYFYDDDGNSIRAVTCCTDAGKIFIYNVDEDGHASVVGSKFGGGYGILGSFTYVESLVSPFPPEQRERELEEKRERERKNGLVMDFWAPWRGKYLEATREELRLIVRFLYNIAEQDEEEEESERFGCPNLRSRIIKFIEQVRQSKGYDVDEDIDELVSSSWKKYAIFIPRNLNDEENYSEAMAATKFTIGEINNHMGLMKQDKRYELVSVEKLVSTRGDCKRLLLTFTAKEMATQDLETFEAILSYSETPTSTFELRQWKFKPLPIHKL